jgi:hypothetical protein
VVKTLRSSGKRFLVARRKARYLLYFTGSDVVFEQATQHRFITHFEISSGSTATVNSYLCSIGYLVKPSPHLKAAKNSCREFGNLK